MRRSSAVALLGFATVVTTAPTGRRQSYEPDYPDTVYGIDPSKPFTLVAYLNDYSDAYQLQPFYVDHPNEQIALQGILESENYMTAAQLANFTLKSTHYGTQLYASFQGPCPSASKCNATISDWSNDWPSAGSMMTFHMGKDGPSFGGLALWGLYDTDWEGGEIDYLSVEGVTDYQKAWTMCNLKKGSKTKILSFQGTDKSCVGVTIGAFQTAGY